MEIIVPAAGLSTRFPNTKPKYLLFDYSGTMMLKKALMPYLNDSKYNITVGILSDHEKKYNASEFILNEVSTKINIVILPNVTRGPADTVMQIIEKAKINSKEPLLVKDCDSYFSHSVSNENYVCVSDVNQHSQTSSIVSKSFILENASRIIKNIVEKTVVSDKFCVGGYNFSSVDTFKTGFLNICDLMKTEIYISHVIQWLINNGEVFISKDVQDYVDVGTIKEWNNYNNKPTIFCDIDGTIIVSQSRYGENNYNTTPTPLSNNIEVLKKHQQNGCQIIFVTSRPNEFYFQTDLMLKKLGFKNYQLITGLNNSYRILINDFNSLNPYPRAVAVNLKRDSDNLSDYLQ